MSEWYDISAKLQEAGFEFDPYTGDDDCYPSIHLAFKTAQEAQDAVKLIDDNLIYEAHQNLVYLHIQPIVYLDDPDQVIQALERRIEELEALADAYLVRD